jgi:signal peptide peptidase SppA
MNISDVAAAAPWAMLPERVEQILNIAAREHDVTPEMLEAYRGVQMQKGERVRVRDGIAVISAQGPMFKRANLFVEMSGATSYDIIRRDLQVAMDDPSVHAILTVLDSPGGEANGVDELARAIYEFRGKKPMTAFVSGQAASAAYWLASAHDRIVVSDAAILGSIGVVLGVTDTSARDEKSGVRKYEFVSSQSPGKRPDVASDAGRARVQRMVDELANVFIGAVARNRGVSADRVVSEFGGGGVEIGARAVALGMADSVGTLEAEISALKKGGMAPRNRFTGGLTVSDNNPAPAADAGNTMTAADVSRLVAEATARAVAETTARLTAISAHAHAGQFKALTDVLSADTSISAETAAKILDAAALGVPPPVSAEAASATFVEQKSAAGAIGLNLPAAPTADAVKAGWNKATAQANRRFDVA